MPTPPGDYGFYDWEGHGEFHWAGAAAFMKVKKEGDEVRFRIYPVGRNLPDQIYMNDGHRWVILRLPFEQGTAYSLRTPGGEFVRLSFIAGEVTNLRTEGVSLDFRNLGFAVSRLQWRKDEIERDSQKKTP
ncbi:MAG: hypothetical protein HY644_02050 [Acidobacteria bacterium]|nr:hypothetical protein [Acidobacteriota bacterium]